MISGVPAARTSAPARRRPATTGVVVVVVGLVACVLSVMVAITLGTADISLVNVRDIVGNHLGVTDVPVRVSEDAIVWQDRLPRSLVAAAAGAGLAICGVVLQSLLRNPLADPFLLGISSGASTGAVVLGILGLGAGTVGLSGGAFVGALVAFGLVLLLARLSGGTTDRLVLAGIAVTQLFSALTSLVVFAFADADEARGVLFWLLGSLEGVRWGDVRLAAAVAVIGVGVCWVLAHVLDAFTFGDDVAASLGVPVGAVRAFLLVMTALVTAALVSVTARSGSSDWCCRMRPFPGGSRPRPSGAGRGGRRGRLHGLGRRGVTCRVLPDAAADRRGDGPDRCPGVRGVDVPAWGSRMTLTAHDVSWVRGGALVVDGVTLEPAVGETIGLLGPNGSGKSSLLRLLAGLDRPTAGIVRLDDAELRSVRRRDLARSLAVVTQESTTEVAIRVRDVVALGPRPSSRCLRPGSPRRHRRDRRRPGPDRSRRQGGSSVARVVRRGAPACPDRAGAGPGPSHLLLDEPTNHLDIRHQLDVLGLVARLPTTAVVALHDLNLAAMFCDRLVVLRSGSVVAAGAPADVLTPELIADVYDVRADVVRDVDGAITIRFGRPSVSAPT